MFNICSFQASLLSESACVHTVFLFSGVLPRFFPKEKSGYFMLKTFTLVMGEKMRCEVILPRDEMKG